MQLGIFAKTFPRPTLEETLDAVAAHGLTHVQFNMSCMGVATLPDRLDEGSCVWIAQSLHKRGLKMAAISGTFNMCDPSDSRLEHNLRRLDVLAAACRWLDTRIITLCTGTLDSHDMWKWHVDNARKSTWERLIETMRAAVKIADRHEVTLAFEPEINNVVSSVMRARKLLDAVDSPWLKVVIDPANLLASRSPDRTVETFNEAFDWLEGDIVLAHAKNPSPGEELASGDLYQLQLLTDWAVKRDRPDIAEELNAKLESDEGTKEIQRAIRWLPFYRQYFVRLADTGYQGALIMHGLEEADVSGTTALLKMLMQLATIAS
jgi:sugar phosphate isomerase/epimerase